MSGQSPYMSTTQYGYPSNFQQRETRYAANSNVETAMALNRRPSLLAGYHNHFSSPERPSLAPYIFSLAAPMSMGPHVDEHSKRSHYPTTIPLSIDVKKEQPLYQPQTEAISPILDEPKIDSNLRNTTIIRNSISKLESDIEITMKKLHRAKLSQNEIKSQADRSAADEEENDDRVDVFRTNGSQTLIEKILHDNRKKAEDGQKVLNQLNNNMDLTIPLYQEPSDLESIGNLRIQYMNVMKNRLVNIFKKSRERYMCRTKFESEKYDHAYQQWQKSIEKDEKIILAKDVSTYREAFEKTFPELRKAREDKEKKQSLPTTNDSSLTSTEPQLQPITPSTTSIEQEHEDEQEQDDKMRKSSVIPPIMYDPWQRKHHYFNQNGFVQGDPGAFYKEEAKMPFWAPEERQIFVEKFTQSPKNFGYISSFLENKTTEQCVQFYYMTKKTENYKNLLRKQSQANKRKPKQTTTTTTTVTSSTTIETTLVTKVTSANTIVSSTSQQLLGTGQDAERSIDRMDTDEERRDINSNDTNEEKRSNKTRCQLLSCTTEKLGKKKNRKNRFRAFPTKWNELSEEHREEIRRSLQIPSNVHRCCTRCYEKLIIQVRQRHTNQTIEEEDDDNDGSTITVNQNLKNNDEEWNETDIDAFTQAIEKFNHDWTQIAEHCHRSEESCRAFYIKQRKNISPTDDHNIDEDNGSISGSELGHIKQSNDDNVLKTINEDSNDSTHGMVIDEGEEQTSINEEKELKPIPPTTNLTTIASLVEKEISKTLNETEKRLANNNNNNNIINTSPERPINTNNNNTTQPPPLVTITKSHSPATSHQYPSHSQQQYLPKGSIMRGTPISSSTPTNKPIAIDISSTHSHPHHYSSPRNDYLYLKSPKILDRNIEQQQQQQQHHLLQQQHAAYMRHYTHQPHQQQQQQQPQHKTSSNKIDPPGTDTFETLRADYVTSKYLTTATHSPNHERQHRTAPDQRSPPQPSPSINQPLLPPPTTIAPPTSNPSVQASPHSHHSQQQAALLAASQLFASSGVNPQDLIASGLLPYASYYGSLPTNAPFLFDPRMMHEYATAAANNEQLKAAMRLNRLAPHHHHPSSIPGHSPPEPSYPTQSPKRHSHDLGYSTGDYPASIWRTQNMTNPQQHQQQQQQFQSQMKLNPGINENPLLKLNELSRHSSTRAAERNSRSPDDYHHRVNQSRTAVESPSIHFQRVEAHNHHKSSHEKSNPNLHFTDHSTEPNPLNYMRQPTNIHKPQTSHHSPHRHHHHPHHNTNPTNRTLVPPMQPTQISPHHPAYLMHGHHHSPVDTVSPQRQQQRTSHHNESIKNPKEQISIQEFINKNVDAFVSSTNNPTDSTAHESSNNQLIRPHQANNSDQPILLDGDDDSNPTEQSDMITKSNPDSEMPERRRDSSIKKILSNQPLEKQEYVEINQKVQNSTVGASKVHTNADQTGLERSNSLSGRTRSRGSITMRMLMGANDIYADGKAQPQPTNDGQTNKRSVSPNDKCEKIEYLIRDELDRTCPTIAKRDETVSVFQKTSTNPQQNSAKRLRTSPKEDEQRHSSFYQTHESPTNLRDPFTLQPHSKGQHHQLPIQQQYHLANSYPSSFASRSSRPTGSITQGSPISPSLRLPTDQQQYSSATNNQLVNPRYSYHLTKNEQQSSPSPHDHSPKAKIARRLNQTLSSPSEVQPEATLSTSGDHSSSLKSPSTTTTPPLVASPSAPNSTNSAHPLKKRLISEYELEQQRNSPVVSTEKVETIEEVSDTSKDVPNTEIADEIVPKPLEESENST